jgi:hypothetical protein
MLQGLTAPLTLGPSIFNQATAQKEGAPQLVPLEQLFCCPDCGHEPLLAAANGVRCPACRGQWPLENGIYVFK